MQNYKHKRQWRTRGRFHFKRYISRYTADGAKHGETLLVAVGTLNPKRERDLRIITVYRGECVPDAWGNDMSISDGHGHSSNPARIAHILKKVLL